MKCCYCGKQVAPEEAMHCSFCGRDYCSRCASTLGICDCYGDFEPYH